MKTWGEALGASDDGAVQVDFVSRRAFVFRLLGGLVAWTALVRYLSPRRPPEEGWLRLKVEEVPVNGALVDDRQGLAVVRQGQELYALSLRCTHLGCTLVFSDQMLVCPCHGSRFDIQGTPLCGPATRPLERLSLRREKEALYVALPEEGGA